MMQRKEKTEGKMNDMLDFQELLFVEFLKGLLEDRK